MNGGMADSKPDAAAVTTAAGDFSTTPAVPASNATVASTAAAKPTVLDAPDPDEDDLDDLDDMLDEFSTGHPQPNPASSGPGRPQETTKAPESSTGKGLAEVPDDENITPEQFADMFQKEMEALMKEQENNPQLRAGMEALVQGELAKGLDTEGESPSAAPSKAGEKTEESFQETIRKTMERMQNSGDEAGAAAARASAMPNLGIPGAEGEMLAQLMQELMSGEGGGAGDGNEDEFSKMLLGMMEQLTNKEILYEPMKDLHDRFPAWMETNAEKTAEDDLKRYKEQQRLVGEIISRFERQGYSDENTQDREYIVERMQQMQSQGTPPDELVGNMKETQDALGDLDAGCPQQ